MRSTQIPSVVYIRMSSTKQDASPEQQRAEAAKLAVQYNCRILREYTDEGISGDSPNRPGFQQMLHDAVTEKDFSAIICWDQDRFARFDSIRAGKYIDPLREAGVLLITKAQGVVDWNTFTGRMMYSIIQEGKHQYLLDLSRNVLRGRIASAKRGQLIVQPAYGYDRVFYDEKGKLMRRVPYGEKFNRPRGWVVKLEPSEDVEKVTTVHWLMDTYAHTDCSIHWMAMELNRRKISAPRGHGWSSNTVRHILGNRVYLGVKGFGERRSGKYYQVDDAGEIGKAEARKWVARKAPVLSDIPHEPLVSEEVFERVQQKLAMRGVRQNWTKTTDNLLSGLLICGHCGRSLCAKTAATGKRRYYACPAGRDGRCSSFSVRKEIIEEGVENFLLRWLNSEKALEQIESHLHSREKAKSGFGRTMKSLQDKIAAFDEKIANGTKNLAVADIRNAPDLQLLLNKWRDEREALRIELATTQYITRCTPREITKRAIRQLPQMSEYFKACNPIERRHVIRHMVSRIVLTWQADHGKRRKVKTATIEVVVAGFDT